MSKINFMKSGLSIAIVSLFLVSCDEISKKAEVTEPKPSKNQGIKIDKYTAYANGTAVDNETGMMWDRCSIGQKWDSEQLTCTGEAQTYNWEDALKAIEKLNANNHLGYSDWQLPHIEDLSQLRYCSDGFEDKNTIPTKAGGEKEIDESCKGDDYQIPTTNKIVFPNIPYQIVADSEALRKYMPDVRPYWSRNSFNDNWAAYVIDFTTTNKVGYGKNSNNFVRAVREIDKKE